MADAMYDQNQLTGPIDSKRFQRKFSNIKETDDTIHIRSPAAEFDLTLLPSEFPFNRLEQLGVGLANVRREKVGEVVWHRCSRDV